MSRPKVVILIGPPGAGKGTQAELLIKKFGLDHLSTGNLVRGLAKLETPLGVDVRERMERGVPQPDDIILKAIAEYVPALEQKKGVLFDAFPLSVPQAEGLEKIIDEYELEKPIVIFLEVRDVEILRRLSSRKTCKTCRSSFASHMDGYDSGVCVNCGGELYQREDDKEEVVKNRIEQYRERMRELFYYYTGKNELVVIDGEQTIEAVHRDVAQSMIDKGYEYGEEQARD